MLDNGDIVYMHASTSTLKPLVSVNRTALQFITGDKLGWDLLVNRREQHCMTFIYTALLKDCEAVSAL